MRNAMQCDTSSESCRVKTMSLHSSEVRQTLEVKRVYPCAGSGNRGKRDHRMGRRLQQCNIDDDSSLSWSQVYRYNPDSAICHGSFQKLGKGVGGMVFDQTSVSNAALKILVPLPDEQIWNVLQVHHPNYDTLSTVGKPYLGEIL